MINKNDIRYVKTEMLIEDTYYQLKSKSKSRVKVIDLCEQALINKSTFYAHYQNIDQLHDVLCNKLITKILNESEDISEVFNDAKAFVASLMHSIQRNESSIEILFSNNKNSLVNKLEDALLKLYLPIDKSPETKMKIIFATGGISRLLINSQDQNRLQMATELLEKIL